MTATTRCAERGCPHRFRLFTLDWPWRCPGHRHDYEFDELAHSRAVRLWQHRQRSKGKAA